MEIWKKCKIVHALIVAQDRVLGAVDASGDLQKHALEHLLGGEELSGSRMHVLLPGTQKNWNVN